VVPIVPECIGDTKKQVKTAAVECLSAATTIIGNRDIDPVLVVGCVVDPNQTSGGVPPSRMPDFGPC